MLKNFILFLIYYLNIKILINTRKKQMILQIRYMNDIQNIKFIYRFNELLQENQTNETLNKKPKSLKYGDHH